MVKGDGVGSLTWIAEYAGVVSGVKWSVAIVITVALS